MNTINGKGHFVRTISGLVSGDMSIVDTYNTVDIRTIASTCDTLRESGVARQSRKGWWTIEHPLLGLVQWKSGIDFRSAKEFFLLRVHGQLVVRCWPDSYQMSEAKWEAKVAQTKSVAERDLMEQFLGSLDFGTRLPLESRNAA